MGVALKKSSIDLGIVTTNGAAMLAFYRDVLGFRYEREMPMPVGTGVMHRMFCGDSLIKLVVLPAAPAKAAPMAMPTAAISSSASAVCTPQPRRSHRCCWRSLAGTIGNEANTRGFLN